MCTLNVSIKTLSTSYSSSCYYFSRAWRETTKYVNTHDNDTFSAHQQRMNNKKKKKRTTKKNRVQNCRYSSANQLSQNRMAARFKWSDFYNARKMPSVNDFRLIKHQSNFLSHVYLSIWWAVVYLLWHMVRYTKKKKILWVLW